MNVATIETLDGADMALQVMLDLDARKAKVDAELDQALARVRDSFADKYKIDDGQGNLVPMADVYLKAYEALRDWAEPNRDEILGDSGKKSIDLPHGTFGWKKDRDSVDEIKLEEDEAKQLQDKGLLAKCFKSVVALVGTLTAKLGKLPISNFINIKCTWDKSSILDAFNKGNVTAAQLEKQGLAVSRGIDQFFAKPKSEKRAN